MIFSVIIISSPVLTTAEQTHNVRRRFGGPEKGRRGKSDGKMFKLSECFYPFCLHDRLSMLMLPLE